MKAFGYQKYGSPDHLLLMELPQPEARENEVLIRVHALSLNPAEWHQLVGKIWVVRLAFGLFAPRRPVMGADIAGEVVAVGSKVQNFKVGDRVFGRNDTGGLAEYSCLEADKAALIPAALSYEQAAALPLASCTALAALRDKGQIQAGEDILINGASGGIGTFAVPLAKHFGARVTGVCSGKNRDLAQSLGADAVIDYTQEDFTQSGPYDLIIDLVGNRSVYPGCPLFSAGSGTCAKSLARNASGSPRR